MALVHNERTKLTATFLNGVAIAVFAVGAVAPVVAVVSGTYTGGGRVAALGIGCIVLSGILHFVGRLVLGRLRE